MKACRKDIAVIIVGGGASRRYGAENKLLTLLKGVPVFIYGLRNFSSFAAPGNLIFAAPAAELKIFQEAAARFLPDTSVTWVQGGNTRLESVRNGLEAVTLTDGVVAIHDAARPLADGKLLTALCDRLEGVWGVIPGKPVTDTIKRCSADGVIEETVDRESLWRVETPQLFDIEKLRDAYRKECSSVPTDDAAVMENAGYAVAVYHNPAPNLKLTYPEEFKLLEELI